LCHYSITDFQDVRERERGRERERERESEKLIRVQCTNIQQLALGGWTLLHEMKIKKEK